jgi:hypothetical protein
MRTALIAAVLLSGPLFLWVLVEGVRRMHEVGGAPWFIAGCSSVVVMAWCFARLVDSRPPRP